MTSQKATRGSLVTDPAPTASDRCDCDWCETLPRARALFWRCYVGGLALLVTVLILVI